ncbi:MAG: DsbA family protein [Patescibacteria group bacterium]|jgi:protein-disulfide isomerase
MNDVLRQIRRHPWALAGGVLSVIVLIGLGMFAFQVASFARDIKEGKADPFESKRREASVTQLLAQTPLTDLDLTRIESKGTDPMLGNPAAKIRIVEFLDYECPFCRASAPDVRTFLARHPDDVLLIVRDFPLESIHSSAMNAAIAARCVFAQGDANRFWRYHDILFSQQDDLGATALRDHAATVGADLSAFDACVASRQTEEGIRASIADGTAAGVRGTPSFFVNGYRIQGTLDLAALEEIFSQLKNRL